MQDQARAAGALIKLRHIGNEAYNIIAVEQNGADKTRDLLDTLNEYSARMQPGA